MPRYESLRVPELRARLRKSGIDDRQYRYKTELLDALRNAESIGARAWRAATFLPRKALQLLAYVMGNKWLRGLVVSAIAAHLIGIKGIEFFVRQIPIVGNLVWNTIEVLQPLVVKLSKQARLTMMQEGAILGFPNSSNKQVQLCKDLVDLVKTDKQKMMKLCRAPLSKVSTIFEEQSLKKDLVGMVVVASRQREAVGLAKRVSQKAVEAQIELFEGMITVIANVLGDTNRAASIGKALVHLKLHNVANQLTP